MSDAGFWILSITVCLVAIVLALAVAYDPRDEG